MTDRPRGTLVVLGAGVNQVEIIEAARGRGLRVVAVDNIPSSPGHRLADRSWLESTTDVEAVERIARDEAADGIVAACSDVAVPTAAIVAKRLGLAGVPVAAASVVTSKAAFRRWQADLGLSAPASRVINVNGGRRDLPSAGRWIVKPDRSSGSKGTRITDGADQLRAALDAAAGTGEGVIVEEVLEGHHVTVEGLLKNGRIVWSVVLDRQTAELPWVATVGHRLPSVLDDAAAEAAVRAVAVVAGHLGFENGPFDADLVIGEEPSLLEMSPRLGGNGIARLLELATGVNLIVAAIDAALGVPLAVPVQASPSPTAVVLLGVDSEGTLAYDCGNIDRLRREPWVELVEVDPPGTSVRPFTDGRAALGRVFLTAPTRGELDRRAASIPARLGLKAL